MPFSTRSNRSSLVPHSSRYERVRRLDCSVARLALNRNTVLQYRAFREKKQLAAAAAATINVRLAAVRRLAYEAADGGILSRMS